MEYTWSHGGRTKKIPRRYHSWKHDQCPFSSTEGQNQLIVQIALTAPAMSMDLSASASFLCQNPTYKPTIVARY